MRFGRPNRVVYKNLALDTMVDSRDFMQKQFLITGPPQVRKWKIGTKQKEILGYHCLEASVQMDSATFIVAWFTPQLSISNGPSDYQGLPGMILGIDINEGTRMVTATEIQLDSVDTAVIVAPDKGKEVTPEEFEKIREEKMKEMGMQRGGPGGQQMFFIRQ
jgi:GLPGLI family protein